MKSTKGNGSVSWVTVVTELQSVFISSRRLKTTWQWFN